MAQKTEIENLSARKAWLVQQNDSHRNDLLAEADNLRQVCGLVERGYGFYQVANRVRAWMAPFSGFRIFKKRTWVTRLVNRCGAGWKIWREFRER